MYEIIPGILEKDWREIEKKIELVKGFAPVIHIDIIDGKFVDNTTFLDPEPFKKYSGHVSFELHMMVDEPINYLEPFYNAGFRRFIGHVEKMSDQTEFVAKGQLMGEVGLALDGKTSINVIKVDLSDLDTLLIMGINAGFSNQSFVEDYSKKIQLVKDKTWIPVEVDGVINDQTIVLAKKSGATRFVTTSFLFNGNPQEQYEKLQKAVDL